MASIRQTLFCGILTVGALLAAPLLAAAQGGKNLPRADAVVKPKTYVSVRPVPRGAAFEIAVVADIIPGFHVNSNKPSEDYLIPTVVQADLPAGLKLTATEYPAGKLVKFGFSDTKLSVYDGRAVIRMKLQTAGDAALGKIALPLTLRYQACNDSTCLPPAKLALTVDFEIATAGTKSQPANPEIFRKR